MMAVVECWTKLEHLSGCQTSFILPKGSWEGPCLNRPPKNVICVSVEYYTVDSRHRTQLIVSYHTNIYCNYTTALQQNIKLPDIVWQSLGSVKHRCVCWVNMHQLSWGKNVSQPSTDKCWLHEQRFHESVDTLAAHGSRWEHMLKLHSIQTNSMHWKCC